MEPTNEQNEEFIKLLHTYNANINEDLYWFMLYCHSHVLTMKNAGLSFTEICQLVRRAAEIFPENSLFYHGDHCVDKNGFFPLMNKDKGKGDDDDFTIYAKVFVGDVTKYECNSFMTVGHIPYRFCGKLPEKYWEIYEEGIPNDCDNWEYDFGSKK